jgi:hypothetical protein
MILSSHCYCNVFHLFAATRRTKYRRDIMEIASSHQQIVRRNSVVILTSIRLCEEERLEINHINYIKIENSNTALVIPLCPKGINQLL